MINFSQLRRAIPIAGAVAILFNGFQLVTGIDPNVHADDGRYEDLQCYRNTLSYSPTSWVSMRNENVVLQSHDYSCGAGALATVLTYYWNDPTGEKDILADLFNYLSAKELEDRVKNGLSITDLKKIAILRKYRSEIGVLDGIQNLAESKVPLIVAITVKDTNHFVVVRGVIGDYVYLADPTRGNIRMPASEFAKCWVKNAILVVLHQDLDISQSSRLTIACREIDPHYPNRPYVRRMINQFLP